MGWLEDQFAEVKKSTRLWPDWLILSSQTARYLAVQLEKELGRAPTEQEVIERFKQ